MKAQLLLLQSLQDMDAKTQELRTAIVALPEKLRPAQEDLRRLEAMLDAERARVSETEEWSKGQEELMRREEEAVRHAKVKLQASKNAKDYAAASRELDNKRRAIAEREQEILRVMEALESTRTSLQSREADVATLREGLRIEEEAVAEKVAELEAAALESIRGRDEVVSKLDPALVARYESVKLRRGVAVAAVVNGVCQGCHMSLQPQLANILARFESIEACNNCQRLLYRIELVENIAKADP